MPLHSRKRSRPRSTTSSLSSDEFTPVTKYRLPFWTNSSSNIGRPSRANDTGENADSRAAMIYMIDRTRFGEFIPQLTEMHRLRFRVFKERLNWDVTVSGDLEIDEYDALNPIYLLYCNSAGRV